MSKKLSTLLLKEETASHFIELCSDVLSDDTIVYNVCLHVVDPVDGENLLLENDYEYHDDAVAVFDNIWQTLSVFSPVA